MVTLWISDYVLNTVGYVLHKHNILHGLVTKNDLPKEQRGYLDTTCTSVMCFGNLVPQVAQSFPNASVEMEMVVTAPPTVEITASDVIGHFAGVITYRARLANGSVADLFKTKLNVGMYLNIYLNNSVIKGKVVKFTSAITVTESHIGPISSLILNAVLKLAANFYIIPKLDMVGERGIPIPVLKNVRFTNTQLHLESHGLRIATDVVYSPAGTVLRFHGAH